MLILLCSAVIIGTVVIVHELGHFVAARVLGIRIITVSLGFGPRLWTKRIGETVYCVSVIPLGGYVRPFAAAGEAVEHSDTGIARSAFGYLMPLDNEERIIARELSADDPGNLLRHRTSSRLMFAAAGVVFNVLLSFIVAWFGLHCLRPLVPTAELRVGALRPNSPAAAAGVKVGDVILAVDGGHVETWTEFQKRIETRGEIPVELLIKRDEGPESRQVVVDFVPRKLTRARLGNLQTTYASGVKATFVPVSRSLSWEVEAALGLQWEVVQLLIGNEGGGSRQDASPEPAIYGVIGNVLSLGFQASQSWSYMMAMFCTLSIVTACLNLLPLPMLDGGQIMILILQKVFRVPITVALEQRLVFSGLTLVGLWTLVALGSDVLESLRLVLS